MEKFLKVIRDKTINNIYENFDRYFVMILKGIKHIMCALFVIFVSMSLLEYPLKLAKKYGIILSGTEYVGLYKNYSVPFLGILIISIVAIPAVKLVSRMKKFSKDGLQFGDDEQNTSNVSPKTEVQQDTVEDIINSNDEYSFDEESEEHIYTRRIESSEEINNFLKCKNIKDNMKPLTLLITMELYNKNDYITENVVFVTICNLKSRRKKKMEEHNMRNAKNIIEFLKKNAIIESDDIKDGKYYFTPFGNMFMTYLKSGRI